MKPTMLGSVALGAVGMVCVTVLALARVSTAVIIAVITSVVLPLMGALWGKIDGIHVQTNGNMSELLRLVRDQSDKLAAMYPAASLSQQSTASIPEQRQGEEDA